MSIVITTPSQTGAKRTVRPAAETRAHILDVAEQLFYWDGIRATGVDKITNAAGVAPTTLYRLFASKDDLVAAYVDRYAEGYRNWIELLTAPAADRSPRSRILAFLDGLADNTGPESFRGCPFLMALAEYPDPGSAAHTSAQSVKAWVRAKLRELAAQLPGVEPAAQAVVADQLALIVEGIYASTAALGNTGPARQARALAELVIDTATSDRS
jgi:AcrR family transcriptional regulator